ncbi:DUF1643 domain-containing protein [Kordiimonas sp.]|uniref:DUF1643 domain-containing protein n=1 Tax=Kordiimonas sp. TaxID=1970157 RepID=UPI003A900F51
MPKVRNSVIGDVMGESKSGALFSECRNYRWALWRQWNPSLATCVFIGLNPSTADETEDDPTIRRCIGFAKSWGLGKLVMLNAYGFSATQPKDMKAAGEPVGEHNDAMIGAVARAAVDSGGIVIAAWGSHCEEQRQVAVCEAVNREIRCLGTTKYGRPKHPLYLRADTKPEPFFDPNYKYMYSKEDRELMGL